ncbi:tetratricopeptide repeat protein [Flavobacteriaceae bacterium R38]|nr:tetratricopeptide repeat protein [Flavobacteriaceae bacterium R38]
MRKEILIFSALIITSITFAQKSEIKIAEKALKGGKTAEAKTALESAEPLIANADNKTKAKYYFIKGKVHHAIAKKGSDDSYGIAADAFNEVVNTEKNGRKTYTAEASQFTNDIIAELVNGAVAANQSENYSLASKKLYKAYELNNANQDYLYFAASSAISGKNYDDALKYYGELKELGYTGIRTEFYATNVDTNEEERMASKQQRDLLVRAKTHKNPVDKQTESRLPEIVKNIALIYTQQGDKDKALEAIKEARSSNPDDINLLLTEANLYIQLEQKDKFANLMKEAIEKDPDNPTLYFNLGVINAEQGNFEEAKGYYEIAVEKDPNYKESYLNLASLILSQETEIVDEMNGLGTSKKDNARYDVLKAKREGLYQSSIPYLQKILAIDANYIDALKTLMNIYGTLGENEKFKEIKDRLAAIEQ